ncbi:hypothetical protein O6V14_13025 [Sphingomonas faeni]
MLHGAGCWHSATSPRSRPEIALGPYIFAEFLNGTPRAIPIGRVAMPVQSTNGVFAISAASTTLSISLADAAVIANR